MTVYGGFSLVYANGHRIDPAENDILFVPRKPKNIGVVYCHGAGGAGGVAGQTMNYAKGTWHLAQGLAKAGFHVIDGDLGGPYTFGNDTLAARMESARQVLIGLGCAPQIVTVGASMGNLSQMRYMADHPDRVLCAVGIIPAIDMDQLRVENWSNLRVNIEAAWGLDSVTPFPTRAKPLERVAEMTSVPWAAWYSEADTAVAAQDVRDIAAALGSDSMAVQYSTTLDHGDPVLKIAPYDDMVEWVKARVG